MAKKSCKHISVTDNFANLIGTRLLYVYSLSGVVVSPEFVMGV